VLLAIARLRPWLVWPSVAVLAAIFVAMVDPALPSSTAGIPTFGQLNLLVGALALVLGLNLVASAVTTLARVPGISSRLWATEIREGMFPPAVPIVASVLEYLHGIDLSSMRFAYVGTFLGIPVALTFLYALWRMLGVRAIQSAAAPAVIGLFVAVSGVVITQGSPYLDGPRDQMTATLTESRLQGIRTIPGNAQHIEAVVHAIDSRSSPGDRIFVFPDGQAYYVITGRINPTRVDWYDVLATTPGMANEERAALAANPPEWVFVELYNESDINHKRRLDLPAQQAWLPIYDYILLHYDLVETVDGVEVYHVK